MKLSDRLIRKYYHLKKKFGWHSFYTPTPDTARGLKQAFKQTQSLAGDYYEFGLFEGYSFYRAIKLGKTWGQTAHYFGFDSFEGLPDVTGIDAGWRFKRGQYRSSLEEVTANLKSKNCLADNVYLIKGFYNESLKNKAKLNHLPLGPAKVVLIDSDLYESARDVLNFIYPYLQPGTAILFDDWNCFEADEQKGERRAWREFLALHPEIDTELTGYFGWGGAIFKVKKISA
ncbi:MAG: hypothetical protein A2571_01400 [Candidatus Vogelbacteria bacterium RIFOXYD1_FULL_44_32]|uniref:Methyltransferase n=1 Tax=Candidatus Vogelbacteria bacterium RIFOXYD1_FULL_44_32 TaxID=1802438 RepID=A0A1G2QDA7_9BACT|nr:MAG: hypothetical protein A2571_01400 [Candidatus Vogelbacteria bacterium RIFOXYD1_FULL_44_32]